MRKLKDVLKVQIMPHIEAGSYWVCRAENSYTITSHAIFAKVLHVSDDKVHYIRKQNYGFLDLKPNTLTIDEFLKYYERLED